MADPALVEGVRGVIANRAWMAGMDYAPEDLIDHYEAGTTYVFLRRIRRPEYDDDDQFVGWIYEQLVWAEYRQPEVGRVGPAQFQVTQYVPRVVFRCPWLAAKVTDGGEITIGN